MDDRDTKLGNDLLRALLRHPEAVVVVDEDDHIRLAFKDELEPRGADGTGTTPLPPSYPLSRGRSGRHPPRAPA
jgi:hypothetical protein